MTPLHCSAAILGCEGTRLTPAERAFFADAQPWGFILFARNVEDRAQLSALTSELRESVGWHAPILIDQEGGRVARMRGPHWREWEPVGALCRRLQQAEPAQLWEALMLRYRLIAADLIEVGVDVDCMPLLDLEIPGAHDIIGDRALGQSSEEVASRGVVICEALKSAGVLPVIKHLPGHGRAAVDSHLALPRVETPRSELERTDFLPFAALKDEALGMTAHIIYSDIDPEFCATQSSIVIKQVIRGTIGFDGLLMSDDLSMQALSGPMSTRTRASLDAGCDLALHCNGEMSEMRAVIDAAGTMMPQSLARANFALAQRRGGAPLDRNGTERAYADLMDTLQA
ncbi:MAG: beta-N-acetylhexosaminidase [Neomegalonema sp.]|nr:beta-N-acetylhexosaminidase [Neomegalonema sp.]